MEAQLDQALEAMRKDYLKELNLDPEAASWDDINEILDWAVDLREQIIRALSKVTGIAMKDTSGRKLSTFG